MHPWLNDTLICFNAILISYFLLGNGIYTFLLLLSLRSTWLHIHRRSYEDLEALRKSPLTPPLTVIIPAWNEQDVIVDAVQSALQADYPRLQVIVVDDGSTDLTLERLIRSFALVEMDGACPTILHAAPVRAFYRNPAVPNLLVVSKERGGKPDSLNAGLNLCRTPFFCSLDADCLLERDALLRLMDPIFSSNVQTVVSSGIVRILNGCRTKEGRVVRLGLPPGRLERFQVVEYLRTFLCGRMGWNLLGGTLVVSGAFAVFHRASVITAGGFSHDTVTEDMDMVMQLHHWAARTGRKIRMSFTSEPVCWTECPSTLTNLARQRRRWQLGLCQTLWKHSELFLRKRFGVVGCVSVPFHAFVEGGGAVIEMLGYLLVPFTFLCGLIPPMVLVAFATLSFIYGCFLNIGAVLLEELNFRRYPRFRDLLTLLCYAAVENLGYRQLVLCFRIGGIFKFLTGSRRWEKVAHAGAGA